MKVIALLQGLAVERDVESRHLLLPRGAQRGQQIDNFQDRKRRDAAPGDGHEHPVNLDEKLAWIALDQAGVWPTAKSDKLCSALVGRHG